MSILFKEILIYDKSEQSARKVIFDKGINIITSLQNSVGKTSLSMFMAYAFGAKVAFSDKWDLKNIYTKLTILKNDTPIIVIRHNNSYLIQHENKSFFFSTQRRGYSDKLYELLGFTIKIKDKESDNYSTAIPSIYLLPYYLPQISFLSDKEFFTDLGMYSKNDIYETFYYHIGVLDPNYTNLVEEKTKLNIELDNFEKESESKKSEIDYLTRKLDENKSAAIVNFDKELDSDIAKYKRMSSLNLEIYSIRKRIETLNRQIALLKKTLEDNIAFSNRLLHEEDIKCPFCNNDITGFLERALQVSICNSDVSRELSDLNSSLLDSKRALDLKIEKSEKLASEIIKIDAQRKNIDISRAVIVWNQQLLEAQRDYSPIIEKIEWIKRRLKEQSKMMAKYTSLKKEADSKYKANFIKLARETNIHLDDIPVEKIAINKNFKLSGSEVPRFAISKFLAFLDTKDETINMPVIFDFPNLDMNESNLICSFKSIFERIANIDRYPQSFVFSIDCLNRIAKCGVNLPRYNLIDFDKFDDGDRAAPRLLCRKEFEKNESEINEMLGFEIQSD